ncbi:MAG: DUF99 family protein [Thermoproteota archaeon]|jgi:Uncharacterized conserved protein
MKLVAGIDDGGFNPYLKFAKKKPRIPLLAVYYKNHRIVDLIFRSIKVDGLDATDKLISILHLKLPDIILAQGVTFGGFNIIDFVRVYEETEVPCIIVLDRLPNFDSIFKAIRDHFKDSDKRIEILKKFPQIKRYNKIFYENIGISDFEAIKLIESLTIFGNIPEPVRLAHLICKSIYNLNKQILSEYDSPKFSV